MTARRAAVAAAVVVLAAVALLLYLVLPSGRHTLLGPPGNAFRLSYGDGWRVRTRPPAGAVAALVRPGASLAITRDLPARNLDGAVLRAQVEHDFSERLEDFQLLSAGMQVTDAGRIFVYSYLAPGSRAVHTAALVPAGDHSYDLDAVSPGRLVHEIDAIIRSFRPS